MALVVCEARPSVCSGHLFVRGPSHLNVNVVSQDGRLAVVDTQAERQLATIALPPHVRPSGLERTHQDEHTNTSTFRLVLHPSDTPFHRKPSSVSTSETRSSQQKACVKCTTCKAAVSPPLQPYRLPSLRWHEIQDFVNCCEDDHHTHVDLSVRIGEHSVLFDDEQLLLQRDQLITHDRQPLDTSTLSDEVVRCERCLASIGACAVFQGQPCVSLHRHAVHMDGGGLPAISLVHAFIAVVQERMRSYGWSKFLVVVRGEVATNPSHLLLWIPSPHVLDVVTCLLPLQNERNHTQETFSALKVLFKHSFASHSPTSSSDVVAAWHRDATVAELETTMETLLAVVRVLESTHRLHPPAHRVMASFPAAYLPLDHHLTTA
ncbi:hypothetical protein PTSG_07921 [Salpingoeca rosetta]|uniref:HECT-type E3 ubiquitin transferase E3D n=1 Tax=Salpingoeca rosetta (strain ATCC 50818 / BSB-021) TaxID=946362 RepID=F2UGQ3_SALR5|nr:uncharacterized protein PTSG_07921 [Salpingoeca rosetta]EGD75803.1 hypothetical protein PTSG_07921 [Salpingoeca rosetta]|eukprot:XP_004991724.1 hypothetical protein PTSG_07921 [Salpingoeca rosetta]